MISSCFAPATTWWRMVALAKNAADGNFGTLRPKTATREDADPRSSWRRRHIFWFRTYERCVARFLAPSQFVKHNLIANGWNAKKIDVLPHFQKLPEKAPLPNADAPILYFGRLSAEKGVADLICAMEHTRHIPLVIAGDGPERPALQSLA